MSRLSGETTGMTRTRAAERELHFVTFLLGEWEYAIEVADVCGIYHGLAIIPTPDEPEIITGEIQLATHRIPVVDLRHLLHLPERVGVGWLLVVRHAEDLIGILVDQVSEVIRVPLQALDPSSNHHAEIPAPGVISAVVHYRDRVIHVPDLPRLLRECPG